MERGQISFFLFFLKNDMRKLEQFEFIDFKYPGEKRKMNIVQFSGPVK